MHSTDGERMRGCTQRMGNGCADALNGWGADARMCATDGERMHGCNQRIWNGCADVINGWGTDARMCATGFGIREVDG